MKSRVCKTCGLTENGMTLKEEAALLKEVEEAKAEAELGMSFKENLIAIPTGFIFLVGLIYCLSWTVSTAIPFVIDWAQSGHTIEYSRTCVLNEARCYVTIDGFKYRLHECLTGTGSELTSCR